MSRAVSAQILELLSSSRLSSDRPAEMSSVLAGFSAVLYVYCNTNNFSFVVKSVTVTVCLLERKKKKNSKEPANGGTVIYCEEEK